METVLQVMEIGQDAVMVRTHITVQNRKMKQKILIIIKVYSILMKKSIQIWLLLGTIYIHAQYFRFEYELNCITDTISNKIKKFDTALEITPTVKKFYDMNIFKDDSIRTQNGDNGYTNTGFTQNLLKLSSDQINQSFKSIDVFGYYRLQSKDTFKWKITDERKTESKLTLQKATTEFGGRKWTAWFTQDIPIPEGPYKFGGLPGLIVELYDSKNHYHYKLTRITKLIKPSETYRVIEKWKGAKAIDISRETYQRLLLEHYNEPFKHLLMSSSFIYIDAVAGKRYTKAEQLKEARINSRLYIKKYYNPLELDKAVKYPD